MAMPAEQRVGSNAPVLATDPPVHGKGSERMTGTGANNLGPGSFTTFWTWRGNGAHPNLQFNHPAVTTNSRVLMNISEFGANAQNRFIGSARMTVHNVAPGTGFFQAWVDVEWGSPLNVRFDVLIDP